MVWHVIPKEDCVCKGKRPEIQVILLRPVGGCVKKHGVGPEGNSLDAMLHNVVYTNAREFNHLAKMRNALDKVITTKRSIISMIGLDLNGKFIGQAFKHLLGFHQDAN